MPDALPDKGKTVVVGNKERGHLVLTPNEDGTTEVCIDHGDGMCAMTIARSESRRLCAFFVEELGYAWGVAVVDDNG